MTNVQTHGTLVVLRHGESYSNLEHVYSGWYDTDLTDKGKQDSIMAAEVLKKENFKFDVCYTSLLKRAIRTSWITLDVLDQMWIPQISTWRLNECHFGIFAGKNKEEIYKLFTEEDIKLWKTTTSFVPPGVPEDSPYHAKNDPKYKDLDPRVIPNGESIDMLWKRAYPFWCDEISQRLKEGKTVLIVGHGNLLRSIIKYCKGLSSEELMKEPVVPNGFPYVFKFDGKLNLVDSYLLGDKDDAKNAIYLSDGIL